MELFVLLGEFFSLSFVTMVYSQSFLIVNMVNPHIQGFLPKEIDCDFSFPLPIPKASLGPTSFNVDVSFGRL
jgi:hypothetical protein